VFYFIFSPNNSGTTIMTQYLAQQCGGFMPPIPGNEGQQLPAVRAMMRNRPWDSDSPFDWDFIRAKWLEAMTAHPGKTIFVEASPPNIIRVEAIMDTFAGDMRAVFSISNPFSQIASCIKNYEVMLDDDILCRYSANWIHKATIQRANMERWPSIPRITYEQFCRDPVVMNAAFGIPVVPMTPYPGKGNSRVSVITDMTVRNIGFLYPAELETVARVLEPHGELLAYFGYRVLDAAEFDAFLNASPALAQDGKDDRAGWHIEPRAARLAKKTM